MATESADPAAMGMTMEAAAEAVTAPERLPFLLRDTAAEDAAVSIRQAAEVSASYNTMLNLED